MAEQVRQRQRREPQGTQGHKEGNKMTTDYVVVDFENCLPLFAQPVSATGQAVGDVFDAGSSIAVSCKNSRLVSFHNDYVRDAEEAKRQLSTLLKVPTMPLSATCFDMSQNAQTQQTATLLDQGSQTGSSQENPKSTVQTVNKKHTKRVQKSKRP